MKRIWISLLLALVILGALGIVSFADDETVRLVDNADLLRDAEEAEVLKKLDSVSEKYGMDVVVVTVNSLYGESIVTYADDYYDENGYSPDGVLLLVSMEYGEYYITTTGYGITAFTDAGISYIGDRVASDLGDGNYLAALTGYADMCDEFIEKANTGEPYDSWNLPKEPFDLGSNLLLALVIGLVVAFLVTAGMKSRLRSERRQYGAAAYVKENSMHITEASDIYLYSTMTRTRRVQNQGGGSSTHTSSSGRRHGGGGGRF